MKPTLVSSRTISEINNMIRNSKTLKERYKISLYINIFFFVIFLIGLFVLYKRYKSNNIETKTDSVKQFYNDVNKLYQQQSSQSQEQQPGQHAPLVSHSLTNNNLISHTQQSPVNSNKSLRFDELLPPPVNTFNGDVSARPLPNYQPQQHQSQHLPQQTNYNASPSQVYSQNQNPDQNYQTQLNYNSSPIQNYNSSPSIQNYNPTQGQNQNLAIRDLNDVSSNSGIIDNNLPNNSENWNDLGFMAYNDNSGGYESFI